MQGLVEGNTHTHKHITVKLSWLRQRGQLLWKLEEKKTPYENLSNILVLTSALNSHYYSDRHKALRNFGVLLLLLLFKTFIFLSHENRCCLATQGQQSWIRKHFRLGLFLKRFLFPMKWQARSKTRRFLILEEGKCFILLAWASFPLKDDRDRPTEEGKNMCCFCSKRNGGGGCPISETVHMWLLLDGKLGLTRESIPPLNLGTGTHLCSFWQR